MVVCGGGCKGTEEFVSVEVHVWLCVVVVDVRQQRNRRIRK